MHASMFAVRASFLRASESRRPAPYLPYVDLAAGSGPLTDAQVRCHPTSGLLTRDFVGSRS